jgi:RimJ/RimL family protein N-acetyltransferase
MHGVANLGYWVRSDRTGGGIATRAAKLAVRFGFETLGLHRIEILMQPTNRGSQRVAQKLGATREGRCRHRVTVDGTPRDVLLYALIPSDLRT